MHEADPVAAHQHLPFQRRAVRAPVRQQALPVRVVLFRDNVALDPSATMVTAWFAYYRTCEHLTIIAFRA